MGGALLGAFTMPSFGECPSEENASLLSQILEDTPHPRYSLSPKACLGILRRAEKRGKDLPQELKIALTQQYTSKVTQSAENPIQNTEEREETSHPTLQPELPCTLKIRGGCEGGGKGALIQEDKSGTLSCNNDQTLFENTSMAFAQNQRDEVRDLNDVAGSLTAESGMKQQTFIAQKAYGISSYESNAMKSPNPHSGVYEADTARTLDLNGGNPACNQGGIAIVEHDTEKAFGVDCRNATENEEFTASLQASCNHNLNSGNVVRTEDNSQIVNVERARADISGTTGSFLTINRGIASTLTARDYKDPPFVLRQDSNPAKEVKPKE